MARGFTLAELLIALTILGVIATFTIPKILSSQQDGKLKAIAKETAAAMEQVIYNGRLTGEFKIPNNIDTYFLKSFNAIKVCPNNASSEGCWNTAIQGSPGEEAQPGVVLSSGAVIVGMDDCCYGPPDLLPNEGANGIYMDVNGESGPNLFGTDQFWVDVCFGTVNCSTWSPTPAGHVVIAPDIYQ